MVSQQKQRIEPASAEQPQGPETQGERIGDILRRERERRGDDLQRIADHLCIKTSLLAALENSDYDAFPADAYIIGFLRSYAIYLGFDGKDAIDRYRLEMAGRRRKPALAMPPVEAEGRAPSGLIIVGALIAGILIYAVWYGLSSTSRSTIDQPPALPSTPAPETPHSDAVPDFVPPTETSPAQDASTSAPEAPETAATPQAAPTPAPAPAPVAAATPLTPPTPVPAIASAKEAKKTASAAGGHLQIKALQPSWILIKDGSGATVVDRVMKAGETYAVPDQKGLTLTTGNGSGLSVTLDGKDMPKLSTDNAHVMRDIPLDASHLKSLSSGD